DHPLRAGLALPARAGAAALRRAAPPRRRRGDAAVPRRGPRDVPIGAARSPPGPFPGNPGMVRPAPEMIHRIKTSGRRAAPQLREFGLQPGVVVPFGRPRATRAPIADEQEDQRDEDDFAAHRDPEDLLPLPR